MQVASEIVHEALMLGCDILLADGMDDCDPSSTLQTFGTQAQASIHASCTGAGAEKAGFAGFMVTVDAPRLGNRIADERNKYGAW